jgi:hypothetical protein
MPLTSLKAKSMAAAKQAKYTPQELTAGMRSARWAKLCNTVDPDGVLDAAERNRRAESLLKSQMLNLTNAREMKRKAAKAQSADQQRYNEASAAMLHGCSLCGPVDPKATHKTCEAHLEEMKQRLSR